MSNYSFNYSFNITGNCDVVVQGISQNVEKLNDNIRKSAGLWDSFEGKLLALNQFTQYVEGVGRTQRIAGRSFGHIGRNRREPPPDRGVCPRNGQDLRRLGSAIDRVLQVAAFATVSRAGEIPRCAPRDGRQHRHPEQDDGR